MEYEKLTASEMREMFDKGDVSAIELYTKSIEVIKQKTKR